MKFDRMFIIAISSCVGVFFACSSAGEGDPNGAAGDGALKFGGWCEHERYTPSTGTMGPLCPLGDYTAGFRFCGGGDLITPYTENRGAATICMRPSSDDSTSEVYTCCLRGCNPETGCPGQ